MLDAIIVVLGSLSLPLLSGWLLLTIVMHLVQSNVNPRVEKLTAYSGDERTSIYYFVSTICAVLACALIVAASARIFVVESVPVKTFVGGLVLLSIYACAKLLSLFFRPDVEEDIALEKPAESANGKVTSPSSTHAVSVIDPQAVAVSVETSGGGKTQTKKPTCSSRVHFILLNIMQISMGISTQQLATAYHAAEMASTTIFGYESTLKGIAYALLAVNISLIIIRILNKCGYKVLFDGLFDRLFFLVQVLYLFTAASLLVVSGGAD